MNISTLTSHVRPVLSATSNRFEAVKLIQQKRNGKRLAINSSRVVFFFAGASGLSLMIMYMAVFLLRWDQILPVTSIPRYSSIGKTPPSAPPSGLRTCSGMNSAKDCMQAGCRAKTFLLVFMGHCGFENSYWGLAIIVTVSEVAPSLLFCLNFHVRGCGVLCC